jgi:hypothetical protein
MRAHTKIIVNGFFSSFLALAMILEPARALAFQPPAKPSSVSVSMKSHMTSEALQLQPFWWHISCAGAAVLMGPLMAFPCGANRDGACGLLSADLSPEGDCTSSSGLAS